MTIKVLYYVDTKDNTKGSVCAIPSDKDMRNAVVINKIAEEIRGCFAHNSLVSIHSISIAKSISHFDYANMDDYEFGVEEVEVIEC